METLISLLELKCNKNREEYIEEYIDLLRFLGLGYPNLIYNIILDPDELRPEMGLTSTNKLLIFTKELLIEYEYS